MNFIISANTDVGIAKASNQDSLSVLSLSTPLGKMAFAVLCDGMGGLEKGEVASASLVKAFRSWATDRLPQLCRSQLTDNLIRTEWEQIIQQQNEIIKAYGAKHGVRLGTTAVVMLLTQTRYYMLNVGDSRAYEIADSLRVITNDQTFVAREVSMGRMTPEQAKTDSRRSVLLQCVGASDSVYPEMYFGETKAPATYMMCSDGFRHEISADEIYARLQPNVLGNEEDMKRNTAELIEMDKQRREQDNISALLVRTY